MMRCGTGLHADEAGLQAFEKVDDLRAAQSPSNDGLSGGVDAVDLKPVLGEIEADGGNLHGGRLLSFVEFSNDHHFGTSMPGSGSRPLNQDF
jgi:hypothetical protein